jgi:DNA-binding transcriptional MerR regulator
MEISYPVLTIQGASEKIGVSKHTLRFWEKELGGIIVPLRTQGGQRRYTHEHLMLFEEIKRLKNEGMCLANVKRTMENSLNDHSNESNSMSVETIADQIADIVRSAVCTLLQKEIIK